MGFSAETRQRLDAARSYLDRGWSLLPLAPRSKDPHAALLPRNQEGEPSWNLLVLRPASWPEVRYWFELDPSCNLGILTGKPSRGLVVADFDLRPPHLPVTATSRTYRGVHAFFQTAFPVDAQNAPWGELKSNGGYVVVPPSRHPSGCGYEWFPGFSPSEMPLASLQEAQLGLVLRESTANADFKIPNDADWEGNSLGVASNSISCFGVPEGVDGRKFAPVVELVTKLEVALKVAPHCGIEARGIGKPVLCPIHSEEHPSAALWHRPGCPVRLLCLHTKEWWPLPDLFAAQITGTRRILGKGERAIWWLRALDAAGVLSPPPLQVAPLPDAVQPATRKLYEGFCYLLRLRLLYDGGQVGTPFSWRFALGWCGIGSPTTVAAASKWLLGHQYLVVLQQGTRGGGGRAALVDLGPAATAVGVGKRY